MKSQFTAKPAPKSVLVVEDDRAIREMLKNVLEMEGYQVRAASNGREGLGELKRAGKPSVVLLDMMMPEMSGWDFLDVLRSDPELRSVPVIVVSAYSEIAKSVRPSACVSKPIKLPSLLKAIEESAA